MSQAVDEGERAPCPRCGSTRRHLHLELFDHDGLTALDTLEGKVKDPSHPGRRKVRQEFFYGADLRRSEGDYVYKEREIDRAGDRYRELVKDHNGEVLRDVEEPLSQHLGRGSVRSRTTGTNQEEASDGDAKSQLANDSGRTCPPPPGQAPRGR